MTDNKKTTRRDFLCGLARYLSLGALGVFGATLWRRGKISGCRTGGACGRCPDRTTCVDAGPPGAGSTSYVWQLDPMKCIQCGRCATACVLSPSAVKCVHAYAVCGYCELCFGYFQPEAKALNENAENQLCPTGAIVRTFVEDPYYQYTINEPLCVGCGKCVKGCGSFGNGSLFLQVSHDRCVNCNECAIARACPADAFRRVPAAQPCPPCWVVQRPRRPTPSHWRAKLC